jgi:hypothetical protein
LMMAVSLAVRNSTSLKKRLKLIAAKTRLNL